MDLQVFLARLETFHLLRRIDRPVSCDLELADLCRQEFISDAGGKALLFANVLQATGRVAANLFGSEQRLLLMLRSTSIAQLADKLRHYLKEESAETAEKQIVAVEKTALRSFQKTDLNQLPAVRTWPGEDKRYFTLALTVTKHPETGDYNLGLYRAQRRSATTIALNFAAGSGAAQHLAIAKKNKTPLPVALVLGADPALIWAAAAPLAKKIDEFDFCSKVFASENRFINCQTQELLAPASSELIIEGTIDPFTCSTEGPFGNHTGQYVTRQDCPLVQATGILAKSDPILPVTVVGPPPSENVFLGLANEVYIREWLKITYPSIQDINMPRETVFHGASLLSIVQANHTSVREIIDQLWRSGPLKRSRLLIFLDADIDLKSFSECWWRVINMFDSKRLYQENGKLAIDATGVDMKDLVRS